MRLSIGFVAGLEVEGVDQLALGLFATSLVRTKKSSGQYQLREIDFRWNDLKMVALPRGRIP